MNYPYQSVHNDEVQILVEMTFRMVKIINNLVEKWNQVLYKAMLLYEMSGDLMKKKK